MRIHQLTPATPGNWRRDAVTADGGAVAVIVAILAVVLFGMAAFAVDIGNAYAVKRQLSVSADAAALASAQHVAARIPVGVSCATANTAALKAEALAVAESINAQNDPTDDSVVEEDGFAVECTSNGVEVTVPLRRSLDTFFAPVFGITETNPGSTATAVVQVPKAALGLRPIAACAPTVTAAMASGDPFVIYISTQTGTSGAVCGDAANGQWGFANFLDQGSLYGKFNEPGSDAYYSAEECASQGNGNGTASSGGGAECQSAWFESGYGGPVWVPNTSVNSTGLAGNTGLANSGGYRLALEGLVGQIIQVPVATEYLDSSTDRLNVTGVASVRVCSINFGKQGSAILEYSTGTTCGSVRPPAGSADLTTWNGLANNEGALWVEPVEYAVSGVFGGRSDCAIGNTNCDFGTRSVALLK